MPLHFYKWNLSQLTCQFSRTGCHKGAQVCSPRFWLFSTSKWVRKKFALRQFCRLRAIWGGGREGSGRVTSMVVTQGTRKECCLEVCQDSVLRVGPIKSCITHPTPHTHKHTPRVWSGCEACILTNVQIPQGETLERSRAHLLFLHLGSVRKESLATSHWFYLALILLPIRWV